MDEKLKLLVVDDEPDNLDLLYRTFRRTFQVFKAKSGAEALQLLDSCGEMAIIISDQRMPQMNGTDFLSRTVERFPDTIRMVLTGYTDVEDLVSAINSGKVFKYITKPWNPQKLKEVIAQAAETYKVLKQRTRVLSRALRQESLSNEIMKAVRGSLDYEDTLQTVVSALGESFETDLAVLHPSRESMRELNRLNGESRARDGWVYQPQRVLSTVPSTVPSTAVGEKTTAAAFSTMPAARSTVGATAGSPAGAASGQSISAVPDGDMPAIDFRLQALPALPNTLEIVSESLQIEAIAATRIVVPLLEKGQPIATVGLYKATQDRAWVENTLALLRNVSEQVALAISHAKLYQRIHQQSQQMRAELEVARQIQGNLLHQSWTEIPGLKIQARCQPAREVGGDFFEVFVHPQGDIWLAVGDVSGKGVPAALFMASAISVLRRELAQEKSPEPDKVMRNLNQSLSKDLMSNNCFITMALIRYSKAAGQLVYANAGHVYPLVWSHRDLVAQRQATSDQAPLPVSVQPTYLNVRGVPLGILPDWQAPAGNLQLSEGDVVLLTSDGITEATVPDSQNNGHDSMLNQEGLWHFLQQQPADLDLDNLLAYIHSPDGEQEDDQTILSLEVTSC